MLTAKVVLATTFTTSFAIVVTVLAGNALPSGCFQDGPCAAKERYDKAVVVERALKKKVLESSPKSPPPNGTPADWQKIAKALQSHKDYQSRSQIQEKLKKISSDIEHYAYEIKYGQKSEIIQLKEKHRYQQLIMDLEHSNLTPEGKAKLLQAHSDLAKVEVRLRQDQDSISFYEGHTRIALNQKSELEGRLKSVELVESLSAWIAHSKINEQWIEADNALAAAKKDYDAGIVDKNRLFADSQERYSNALKALERVNTELKGKPVNDAYIERTRTLIADLISRLHAIENNLDDLKCFPDVKAFFDQVHRRKLALEAYKLPAKRTPVVVKGIPGRTNDVPASGVFKLVKKEVGHVPGPDAGPYGTWSGSIGESSFSADYKTTSTYVQNASLQANWTVPPDTLKPGDTVELGVVTNGTVTGKDRGAIGLSAGWQVSGSADVLSNTPAFSGISGSGKEYGSGKGSVKFRIRSGGTITISSYRSGISWGNGGNFTPCVYTYSMSK